MGHIYENGCLLTESVDVLNERISEGGDWLISECTSHITCEVNESSKGPGPLKFKGKFQEANAVNKNRRMYPYEILESNVKKLKESISNRGLLGECVCDSDFRVLTLNGWKPFSEIRVGDYVWSRVCGKMVGSKVKAIVDEPYEGSAYKVKSNAINCTFTANHKFLMSKRSRDDEEVYATIKEIHANRSKYNKHKIPKIANWAGNKEKEFIIPGVESKKYNSNLILDSIKFAGFLGIYLAEGCLKARSNRIEICQTNEIGKNLLKEFLPTLHKDLEWKEFKNGFYTVDARLYKYLVPLGNKYTKYIPAEIKNLNVKCLEELIHWFAIGDGRMLEPNEENGLTNCKKNVYESKLELGKYSRMAVFTVSKKLIEDLHECLIKTGRCGSRQTIVTKEDYVYAGRTIKAENKHPLYQLSISRSKDIYLDARFLKMTEIHHVGRMYCLTTEHGNFYMEKEGKSFWTGNCDHPSDSIVHFQNASHLITKLWWDGSTLMGEGEVLDTPSGKVLKSLINAGVRVGISSRGVGNGSTNEDGVLVIGESYKLITFDAVADPSTFSAFQQKIVSGANETSIPTMFNDKPRKNEATCINTVNAKMLIAFLGCLFENKTNEIKERLHS